MNDAAASTPEEIAQTTRYTSYTVFRRLSGLTEDGELTTAQVAEAIRASGGPEVDKRRIEVRTPIRSLGEHAVHVRLLDDVAADVTVSVVASAV